MLLVAGGIFREVVLDEDCDRARELRLAGSGLYAAVAAARLGTAVTLLAPVGNEDADIARGLCENAGVRAVLLETKGTSATFVVDRRAGAHPRAQYRPTGEAPRAVAAGLSGDVVLVFGHPEWDPLADPMLQSLAARETLVFDGQGWLSRKPRLEASRLDAGRHVELCNAEEAIAREADDTAAALARLPEAGFSTTVVKDGRWGLTVCARDTARRMVAPFAGTVQQTIGSGDVFAGAFAAALERADTVIDACEQGARAAAAWIFGEGPLPGEDFAERVDRLRDAPRGAAVPPEIVRGSEATIRHSIDLGSSLLASEVSATVQELGVRTREQSTTGRPHVTLELVGATLELDPGSREPRASVAERVCELVADALAGLAGRSAAP